MWTASDQAVAELQSLGAQATVSLCFLPMLYILKCSRGQPACCVQFTVWSSAVWCCQTLWYMLHATSAVTADRSQDLHGCRLLQRMQASQRPTAKDLSLMKEGASSLLTLKDLLLSSHDDHGLAQYCLLRPACQATPAATHSTACCRRCFS